jgi:hypothetical protein
MLQYRKKIAYWMFTSNPYASLNAQYNADKMEKS